MSAQSSSNASKQRRAAIRRSALWAAWGDALGFMTERANAARVRQRTGQDRVEQTKPWQRKIGGRTGPTVTLPAGCISDDTQLRLSTCRAIRGDGAFDVEPFAKIELATWPAYALGAGLGSTAAANNLKRRDVTWDTNFFDTKRSNYMQGGGNGAAMRIQPHVWSAASPGDHDADVLVNAVVTHGHPRGIVGALFHAACLDATLRSGSILGPGEWAKIADQAAARVVELAHDDHRLAEVWLGAWEDHSEQTFAEAVTQTVGELQDALKLCTTVLIEDQKAAYARAVEALDARGEERGSAIKSAALALLAAHLYQGRPEEALIRCANELWTDTDTIATMAGALLGLTAGDEPMGAIADRDVTVMEADRMAAIAEGQTVPSFPYPSLVTWSSPKAQLDSVVADGDQLQLAGLGPAGVVEQVFRDTGKTPSTWEWLRLWFGQQVLIRRRPRPGPLSESHRVQQMPSYLIAPPPPQDTGQLSLRDDPSPTRITPNRPALDDRDLHELTEYVIDSGFDEHVIGEALLMLARRPGGINDAIGFAAIIAKAAATRQDRERRRSAQS
ncbi:MAG TPA: ADP-ribosylglycohydrolase family protein [Solirubrobacteraceae bacterium]|jgi:ADP-ribosylglycohydrolase|nr:ADP-ribosylglycohydrolase family protein [Solirubrobacteraceae bacterium]